MKKMLLTSTAFVALASGAAMAADLGRPPPAAPVYTKAPPVMIYSWSGCYVGGNGGGVWVDKTLTTSGAVAIPGVGTFASGLAEGSINWSGGVAGGQVGCNYQVSSWVFGVQGDFDWSGAKTSFTDTVFGTTDSIKVKSVASVTGRVGYAWDRFLVYAKGGGAWETDDYTATLAAPALSATVSDSRTGWTVGGGGEYAFTDWLTGFVEYDFYDFGTKTESLTGTVGAAAITVSTSVKETKSVAKAGLNIKFGGWR